MNSKILVFLLFTAATSMFASCQISAQGQNDPWTAQQLLAPADLAKVLNDPKALQPTVYCIGMDAIIKGSVDVGPAMMPENLNTLKQKVSKLPKNASIVVYCGCCPFSRCPNIRPAMKLLKDMQFTNYKLLNLPQNVKVDWMDKGYPVSE
jgi:thiosulfate/3-mercaptopyruvate sulfurtransferase